jgi:hypothetical protein
MAFLGHRLKCQVRARVGPFFAEKYFIFVILLPQSFVCFVAFQYVSFDFR